VEAHDSASGGARGVPAPPSVVFDHNLDSGTILWQRLHERSQLESGLRLIVHLKSGATHVGSLVYFDLATLTISSRERQYEFWVHDLAHVLVVPSGTQAPPEQRVK